jgi:glycosyltransferase involved in cell wall biosynthesis
VRAARALGLRVVSGFHTRFDAYAAHYRLGAATRAVAAYLRAFHNRTSCTLAATTALKDRLVAAGFANVRVLGRGVDTRLFDPARRSAALRRAWGAGLGDLVALYVGRIAPEKNVGLAVEAFRAMQASRPRTRLVLVGDGPLRPSLEAAHPDVIFAGVQRDERLAEHYASADVFLFPSETETYGNVVPEALASGLPVIACDDAAARTLVVPGDNGLLVPRGTPHAFVGAAAVVARTAHALPEMRRQARLAVAPLEWSHVVTRFLDVLRNVDEDTLVTGRTNST